MTPLTYLVALPLTKLKFWHTTHIVFTENQLSPNSISFSLLFTDLPWILQHTRVRSSGYSFNLSINSSSGFGSNNINFFTFESLFSLRFRLLVLLTRWLMMQKEYCHAYLSVFLLYLILAPIPITNCFKLFSLPSHGFFSSFLHSTFSLSVFFTYLDFEEGTPFFKQSMLASFYSLVFNYILIFSDFYLLFLVQLLFCS